MIGKRQEYERMHATEQSLWWYRSLHRRVARTLTQRFGERKDLAILDAGCGTGGLLESLRQQGYQHLEGFDASEDAVAFSRERGFDVAFHNLLAVESYHPTRTYDVIICNDVFCYLNDTQIVQILKEFRRRLRPGGVFITNNNAFSWLGGTHAVALKISKRFVRSELTAYAQQAGFHIWKGGYWSFLLFPPIAVVRSWQNLQLKRGWVNAETLSSDVHLPAAPVNQLLNGCMKLEETLFPLAPLGSSVYTVMEVTHG